VDWRESSKDKDDTTGSKVTSVSSPLPSELGAQSPQLANVSFIMADPTVLAGLGAKRADCRRQIEHAQDQLCWLVIDPSIELEKVFAPARLFKPAPSL
jgi:hypothetical protein